MTQHLAGDDSSPPSDDRAGEVVQGTGPSTLAHDGWLEYNRLKHGLRPLRIHHEDATGRVDAVFYLNRAGRITQPRLNPYTSLTWTPRKVEKNYHRYRHWLASAQPIVDEMRSRGLRTWIVFPAEITDLRPWQWAAFRVGTTYTFSAPLPLSIGDTAPDVRNKVRRASELGYRCDRVFAPAHLLKCLAETEARQGFSYGLTSTDLERLRDLLGRIASGRTSATRRMAIRRPYGWCCMLPGTPHSIGSAERHWRTFIRAAPSCSFAQFSRMSRPLGRWRMTSRARAFLASQPRRWRGEPIWCRGTGLSRLACGTLPAGCGTGTGTAGAARGKSIARSVPPGRRPRRWPARAAGRRSAVGSAVAADHRVQEEEPQDGRHRGELGEYQHAARHTQLDQPDELRESHEPIRNGEVRNDRESARSSAPWDTVSRPGPTRW